MKTVVVTGALGFLGKPLRRELLKNGFRVIGIDQKGEQDGTVVGIDLLAATAREALRQLPRPDSVVHLAALAHNQRPLPGQTCLGVNTRMAGVVIEALCDKATHFVFASSVAVYGEANRPRLIRPGVQLQPASEYGQSKRQCEQMLLESSTRDIDIVRFCPIYSGDRMQDVAKRVDLPGCPGVRMRILPPPDFNLCHLETAVQHLSATVQRGGRGRTVCNVSDHNPYSQEQLRSWFRGPVIPLPVGLFRLLLWLLKPLRTLGVHAVRCNLEKLFFTHLYSDETISL